MSSDSNDLFDIERIKRTYIWFWQHWNDTKGRASIYQYWCCAAINFILSAILGFIPFIGFILSLALIIPGITLTIRRLNDTLKPWYYIFCAFIPIAGPIIMIYFLVQPTDPSLPPIEENAGSLTSGTDSDSNGMSDNDLAHSMTLSDEKKEQSEQDDALAKANKELDNFLGTDSKSSSDDPFKV
ncbi:MAG: DUF805 domain-containing protein [Proteobacteria bacterium]|nr:DUF805 domain-containing protein [Pseudomonadota bacterium]